MDAIEVVESAAATAFLKTTGTNNRNLISSGCCAVAPCRDMGLDSAGQVAWAKAAVAADPKYFFAHYQLGMGYTKGRQWEKSLEASKQAYVLLQSKTRDFKAHSMLLELPVEMLRTIVNSNCEMSRRRMVHESKGQAIRWRQEMSIPRPPKTCTFCWWPGENKRGRCIIVYYCSQRSVSIVIT